MKSEKLNSWLALGANFGVLIGLVFLIFELNQNTEITRVQMLDSRNQNTLELRSQFFSGDLNRVRARLIEADLWPVRREFVQELTVLEILVLSDFFAVILSGRANDFYMCQEGFLDNETCDATFNTRTYDFLILGMHAVGRGMEGYRPSFIAEIRRLSAKAGLPVIGEDGNWD